MKSTFASIGFAVAASAAAIKSRDSGCEFGLKAYGDVSGALGQLSDGQNRVGGDLPAGKYYIKNGGITDGEGRGCILTPPTTQFQCDEGATPTYGFDVQGSGALTYNGNNKFVACATGDNGAYNIYTTAPEGQDACVSVTLNTGGLCAMENVGTSSSAEASSAPASSKPASTAQTSTEVQHTTVYSTHPAEEKTVYSTAYYTVTSCGAEVTNCPAESTVVKTSSHAVVTSAPASTKEASTSEAPASTKEVSTSEAPSSKAPASSAKPSATKAGSACQTELTGSYETPHLIVPVNSDSQDTAYGTQYFASVNEHNSTIFNFDIPSSYEGKQCSVVFLWPEQKDLETSSFETSGSGDLEFSSLSNVATEKTTYANAGEGKEIGTASGAKAGNSYVISTSDCKAGTTQSIEVSATGDLALSFFEDWNPSPIGLFITAC